MRTLAAAAALLALTSVARADGTIVVTAEKPDTSGNFAARVRKSAVKSVAKQEDGWHIYFVAFLKKAAGSAEVNLAFYDQADKKKELTNAFQIATQANAKILASEIVVGNDQGFVAGHTYNMLITRLVGGKEDVYARTTLTLK